MSKCSYKFSGRVDLQHPKAAVPLRIDFSHNGAWPMQELHQGSQSLFLSGFTYQGDGSSFLQAYRNGGVDALDRIEGHFCYVIEDKETGKVHIGTDSGAVLPLFYFVDGERFLFASHPFLILTDLNRQVPYDDEAIADFFRLGMTLDGDTFFSGLKRLPSGQRLEIQGSAWKLAAMRSAAPLPSFTDLRQAAEEVREAFRRALHHLVNRGAPRFCHLSGGVDSRLILEHLTAEQRRHLKFHTRHNPDLSQTEDRDVAVAQRLARAFSLDHVVQSGEGWSLYLDHWLPVMGPTLSGAHGGEFLGGQALVTTPFANPSILREPEGWRLDFLDSAEARDPDSTRGKLPDFGTPRDFVEFTHRQFLRAFRTIIYRSTISNWAAPYIFNFLTLSPFWDAHFLRTIARVPIEYLRDYRLYVAVMTSFKSESEEIPIHSVIHDFSDALLKTDFGRDPKEKQLEKSEMQIRSFHLSQLPYSLKFYQVEKIPSALDRDPQLVTKLLNFESFMKWSSGDRFSLAF